MGGNGCLDARAETIGVGVVVVGVSGTAGGGGCGGAVFGGYPVQDDYGEEDVGVAAHEADPSWFAFEDHEDCEVAV